MSDQNLAGNCLSCGKPTYATDHCGCAAWKTCPDCEEVFETDKDDLRCCLDHLTTKEAIEEWAWELWGENRAYKSGVKTLKAENARLKLALQKVITLLALKDAAEELKG